MCGALFSMIFGIVANVCSMFTLMAILFGFFSLQWYTGTGTTDIPPFIPPGTGVAPETTELFYGIMSNCTKVVGSGKTHFCTAFNWADLASKEQAMVVMLIIAAFIGALSLALALLSILTCCCPCIPDTNKPRGIMSLLQGILLFATCLTMSSRYDWGAPAGTKIGGAYICCCIGIVTAFIAFIMQSFVKCLNGGDDDDDNKGSRA